MAAAAAGAAKGYSETEYNTSYKTDRRPSYLLNALFTSTVNVASRTLATMAASFQLPEHGEKWKPGDHLRFMIMLMIWLAVWFMRVLIDYFPLPITNWSPGGGRTVSSAADSAMDMVLQGGFDDGGGGSLHALGRSLTDILALLNEIPASSTKYQFVMAMADRAMDMNFKHGHLELLEINRFALSSAYARILALLNRSLQRRRPRGSSHDEPKSTVSWASRAIESLPLGSYALPYVKGLNYCLATILQTVSSSVWRVDDNNNNNNNNRHMQGDSDVVSEKLAKELVWLTHKLRSYGLVEETLVQWSHASCLASMAFTINPRVQALIVKTSAILIEALSGARGEKLSVPGQVKSRLLVVWLPVLCHANNGLTYPVLSAIEKLKVERAIDDVMATLPEMDQEVILTNWIRDFVVTPSSWPNLRVAYDRWCQSTRRLAA